MQKNSIDALLFTGGLPTDFAVNVIRSLFETKKTLSVTSAGSAYR